jgi:hypothetical protein
LGIFDRLFSKKEAPASVKPKAASYEGPAIPEAVKWAKEHPIKLDGLDEKSKIRIAQIVSDGIKNKCGIPGISRDIRKEFPNITKPIADSIALNETSSALSHASMIRMHKMGVDGKKWITGDAPCEICAKNGAVKVIPIDRTFPSGDMQPPAHDG